MLIELLLSATFWAAESPAAYPATLPTTSAVPTAIELDALQRRIDKHPARVYTPHGAYAFSKPRFDPAGVWSEDERVYHAPRQALIESGDVRPAVPPRPIGWGEVDSIAMGRNPLIGSALGGALLGAGVGAILGIGVAIVAAGSGEGSVTGAFVGVGAAVFGVIGALMGEQSRSWETVYRGSP